MDAYNANGLTDDEQATFDSLYGAHPKTAEPASPGIFSNTEGGLLGVPHALANMGLDVAGGMTHLYHEGVEPILGTAHGITQLAQAAQGSVGSGMQYANPQTLGEAFTNDSAQQIGQAADEWINRTRSAANEMYRPDPQTTGFVGNALFSASDVITRIGVGNLFAPGTGLLQAAGETGFERTQELEQQGVDAQTAQESGALSGGSLLLFGEVPVFGKTKLAQVLSGALTNTTIGAGQRALDSHILASGGYDQLASQEHWNDASSLMADAIIGGAFHLLPRGSETEPVPSGLIDSALAAKNAQHVMDVAPGVPTDPSSQARHIDALDTATKQVVNGEPVDVEPIVRGANFAPRELSISAVGSIIDNRLSALDKAASGILPREQVQSLVSEANDLEDVIRGEYAARAAGVVRNPATMLSADELQFAENRLSEVKQQLERHRYGQNAAKQAENLRGKLARIDNDADLLNLARSWFSPSAKAADESKITGIAEGIKEHQPEPQSIGERFQQQLDADPEAARAAYEAIPETRGGVVLNTDLARELSPEYRDNRALSDAVHEPASGFIKRLYAEKLAQPTPEGLDSHVVFSAGGTGAGKSTGLNAADIGNPEIVYDTNMNTLDSATAKVEQALRAKRRVTILYTYRDPVEALRNGALPRAMRMGRTVPLVEHVRTHVGSAKVVRELAERYANDPRVRIEAIDNSRGRGNQAPAALEQLPAVEENSLHEKLSASLQEAHGAGEISDAVYRGFAGDSAVGRGQPQPERAGGARGGPGETAAGSAGEQDAGRVAEHAAAANPEAGAGSRAELAAPDAADTAPSAGAGEPQRGAGEARAGTAADHQEGSDGIGLDPGAASEVARARQVAQKPDVTLADGTTAADALRAADQDVTEAQKQASGIDAALQCFLSFGSDL